MRTTVMSGPAFKELLSAMGVVGNPHTVKVGDVNITNADHCASLELSGVKVTSYHGIKTFMFVTHGSCLIDSIEAESLYKFLGDRLGIPCAQEVQPSFEEGERAFFKPNKTVLRITRISTLQYTLEGGIIAGPTELEKIDQEL